MVNILLYFFHPESLKSMNMKEFCNKYNISEKSKKYLYSTALGGISGTLNMTPYEFIKRSLETSTVINNLLDIPSFFLWSKIPHNSKNGFVTKWTNALINNKVQIQTNYEVTQIRQVDKGVLINNIDEKFDKIILSIPPVQLKNLLNNSPMVSKQIQSLKKNINLNKYFSESNYTHLGITYFFEEEIKNKLPLGGHTFLKKGWVPILKEYRPLKPFLKRKYNTTVVSSISLKSNFKHHRLNTYPNEHTHDEIAHIIWKDQQMIDASLPDFKEYYIYGLSNATQITKYGNLPIFLTKDIILGNNLHGKSPYFTASLETAIQCGYIGAFNIDDSIINLPM